MHDVPGLVSVIIPAYNAAGLLPQTIESIRRQTYTNWEIIVVDDGSSDTTANVVKQETGSRIKLVQQSNSGVSAARNNGLKLAAGEYVIFFDADDLMTQEFMELRVNALKASDEVGFSGGLVETFPQKSGVKRAVGTDPEKEILFFDVACSTVPSNYMFKKKLLLTNNLYFNTKLNSTADRFFLLQVAKCMKGISLEQPEGQLLYRISSNSMSHNLSPSLILDNKQFYSELVDKDLLPAIQKAKFKSLYFFSLALGFAKIKYFGNFFIFFVRSMVSHPVFFLKLLIKRLFRSRKH